MRARAAASVMRHFALLLLFLALAPLASGTQTPSYTDWNGLSVEQSDAANSDVEFFNRHNRIYLPGREFVFSYRLAKGRRSFYCRVFKSGDTETKDWTLVESKDADALTVKYVGFRVLPGHGGLDKLFPDFSQTVVEQRYKLGRRQSMGEVPTFGTPVEGCPYVVRPSAYALVQNAAGQLAIIRTPRGCFLPGGGLERNETPQQAVEREAKEECGLVLALRRVLGKAIEIVYSAGEHACFEKRSVFIAADLVAHVMPIEHDHELRWLDLEQALDALSPESHRWALQRFIRPRNAGSPSRFV